MPRRLGGSAARPVTQVFTGHRNPVIYDEPDRFRPERIARRAITFSPGRGGRIEVAGKLRAGAVASTAA